LSPNIQNSFANYDYLNARIRSKASNLLKQGDYVQLANGTIRDLEIFLLQNVSFAGAFQKKLVVSQDSSLKRIEAVIAETETERLSLLRSLAKGEAARLISVYLLRADLLNGRLVLRAINAGKKGMPEPYWQAYGAVSASFFSNLWKTCSDISDCLEYCRSNASLISPALASSFSELARTNDLMRAERMFLRGFIGSALNELKGSKNENVRLVTEFFGRLVDVWNIAIWLRRNVLGAPLTTPYLTMSGTSIDTQRLNKTVSLRHLLAGTPWSASLTGAAVSPEVVQRRINTLLLEWEMSLYRLDLLGIHVALGYAARVFVEWRNLNMIAVGVGFGMNSTEIYERLIIRDEQKKTA